MLFELLPVEAHHLFRWLHLPPFISDTKPKAEETICITNGCVIRHPHADIQKINFGGTIYAPEKYYTYTFTAKY